jgi:AraC-like DNA-binding protein
MFYLVHTPAPPLAAFVENLWLLSDAPVHSRERIIPSGTFELVINLHEDEFRIYDCVHRDEHQRFSGALVSGAYQRPFVIDTREHASLIGVHFKPGGAFPFLRDSAGRLADAHVELDALFGVGARELRERLCAAETPAQRFRILEFALVGRLMRPLKRHGAVQAGLGCLMRNGANVADVAAVVELSHRRFIELFTAEVGMTPKLFARVQRFQRAVALAKQNPSPNWGQLALLCGYFDQSHLIRDL